jgi:pimeloyl-ACP methyl ester carboxylesterase
MAMGMHPFNHASGNYITTGDGANIYYEETGEAGKPVLLLLHGGFGNMEDFNALLHGLEGSFRVIGVDSRGQGKSTTGNRPLSYELLQADVEQLLKQLGIDELSITGFSDGGIVAYRLASFSNLRVKKLITIGARWHSNNVRETKEILGAVNAKGWREKFPGMVQAYEQLNPEPDFDRLADALVRMWLKEESYPNENVGNITADTLVIRGDKDHLVRRKFVLDVVDTIQHASLSNIAFAGHAAHVDEPEVLRLTLNRFLNT